MFRRLCLLSGALMCLLPSEVRSQQRTINGTVKDASGEVVIGASVVVEGTTNGVATGTKGEFTLPNVPATGRLIVSFIGYETTTVDLQKWNNYTIIMETTAISMKDVVVVAYGAQRKESVVGSVAAVSGEDLKLSTSSNMQNALAGRIAGLSTVQTSGRPGGDAAAIYLRGAGTTNGTNPLIMLDGIPIQDLSMIGANEVESISVLKDASATAVFGTRGANGAIIITTRRGQEGKARLSVHMDASMQQFTRTPERLHSSEWLDYHNQAAQNSGLAGLTPAELKKQQDLYTNPNKNAMQQYMYPDHDWYDELLKTFAPQVKVTVDVSGGTDKLQYFVNAGYLHQDGQFKIDNNLDYNPQMRLDRYSFRANVDYKLTKNLKAFLNTSAYIEQVGMPSTTKFGGSFSDKANNMVGEIFRVLLYSQPQQMGPTTIVTPNSKLAGEVVKPDNHLRSAYELINRSGERNDNRVNMTATYGMEWDMSAITKGLSLKGMASIDAYSGSWTDMVVNSRQYIATINNAGTYPLFSTNQAETNRGISKSSYHYYRVNAQASLNYTRAIGKHRVGGLLLMQRDNWVNADAGLPYNMLSYSARATYSYADKYLFEFNFGRNGSEQFHPDRRFGSFPAFSAGWVASGEKFFEPLLPMVSFLKFRGSWGKVGNDQLGADRFMYIDDVQYQYMNNSAFYSEYGSFYPSSLAGGYYISEKMYANPYLTWETAVKTNAGVDLQLFKSINLSFDYFWEDRSNILVSRNMVPELQGIPLSVYPRANIGEMKNSGFEIDLNFNKQLNKDWFISAKGNFSFARNKVTAFDEAMLPEDYVYRYRSTGFPLGTNWGYKIDYSNGNGYINDLIGDMQVPNGQKEYEQGGTTYKLLDYAFGQYQVGDFKYVDQNGDGVIDEKDQVPLGYTRIPEITYGISLSATWRSIDATVFFQGLGNTSQFYLNEGVAEYLYGGMYFDYHKTAWTPERYANGEKITYPALRTSGGVSNAVNDFWVMNRSFFRLKNVEIGYTFNPEWTKRAGISNLRVYIGGQNLLTWDKLPTRTIDPETFSTMGSNLNGVVYPMTKMYTLGVNLNF